MPMAVICGQGIKRVVVAFNNIYGILFGILRGNSMSAINVK